ncbi:hypothetical protein RB195_013233 [Necator americanus]|uniref:Uncharacterized protein n=1 Tax=Necator americanus TaxID=51031 RepID=A0ABR1DUN4_NECAM
MLSSFEGGLQRDGGDVYVVWMEQLAAHALKTGQLYDSADTKHPYPGPAGNTVADATARQPCCRSQNLHAAKSGVVRCDQRKPTEACRCSSPS